MAELLQNQPVDTYVDLEDPENENFKLASGFIEANINFHQFDFTDRTYLIYYEYD